MVDRGSGKADGTAGDGPGRKRDHLREIERNLVVPVMLSRARPLAHSVHGAFPLSAAPLPPKDDAPESASGCQPASTGPQDTDFPGVEQQKGGDSSLQFLWEREQERERHRAPGQDRDGRIGSARKDIDLQRMQQRGEAQALRAGDSRCDKGLDRLQSPVRPTQRVSETDSRARQEESSFLSPAAGRFDVSATAGAWSHQASLRQDAPKPFASASDALTSRYGHLHDRADRYAYPHVGDRLEGQHDGRFTESRQIPDEVCRTDMFSGDLSTRDWLRTDLLPDSPPPRSLAQERPRNDYGFPGSALGGARHPQNDSAGALFRASASGGGDFDWGTGGKSEGEWARARDRAWDKHKAREEDMQRKTARDREKEMEREAERKREEEIARLEEELRQSNSNRGLSHDHKSKGFPRSGLKMDQNPNNGFSTLDIHTSGEDEIDFERSRVIVTPRKTWEGGASGRGWERWGVGEMDSIASSLAVTPPSIAPSRQASMWNGMGEEGRRSGVGERKGNSNEPSSDDVYALGMEGQKEGEEAVEEEDALRRYLTDSVLYSSRASASTTGPDVSVARQRPNLHEESFVGLQDFRETFQNFLRKSLRDSCSGTAQQAELIGDDEEESFSHEFSPQQWGTDRMGMSTRMATISRRMLCKTVAEFENTQMAGNDEAKMKLTQTLLSQLLKESGSTRLDEPRRSETSSYQSSGQGKGGGAPGVQLEIAAIEMLISRLQRASTRSATGKDEDASGDGMAAKVKSGVNAGGEHFIREPVALEARTVGEAGAYAKPWTPALAESRVALAESLGMVRSGPTGMRGTNSTGGGGNVGKDSHKKQKSFDAQVKKFVDAVKVGDVTCVRQMLNADASLCHATIDSSMAFSPLHWASAKNHAEVCLILLEAKANVNCSNRNGVTALHSAALNGSHAVVEVLLEYGADINATDVNGKTAEACARSKKNNCVDLFDIKAIVQEMTNSPGAWTMKKMAELLKLCNQIAPSTCTRHELEERVRTVQPALAHVWQDVLLYRKKFMKASFSFWLSNIRHAKWLARTSIYVQSLCRHKLVLRTFRYWRVLEREYGAWQRGFAASYAFQEAKAHRQMQRKCLAHALAAWSRKCDHKRQQEALHRKVSSVSENHRLRSAIACFQRLVQAERVKTFRNQMVADHALSCALKHSWRCWKCFWCQMRPTYSDWVPIEQRPKTGLGVVVCRIEGTAQYFVKSLVESGAAAKSGKLDIGDIIVAVNDRSIDGVPLDLVSSLMDGPEGTPLIIDGFRGPDKHRFRAEIYRGDKRYRQQTSSEELPAGTGSACTTAASAPVMGGEGDAKMQRALEMVFGLQFRHVAVRTAFESWALRWCETRRLMEIEQACHVSALRGAVRHLHLMAQMSADARQQQRMRRLKMSQFSKQRLHMCLVRVMSRWRVLSHKNRLSDDMIQRCTRPRTLVDDRESVRLAFKAWMEQFWRQISTAALLRTANRRFDRMRCWECMRLWREALRMLRLNTLRATKLAASCAHRLQRCTHRLLRIGLVAWAQFTNVQQQCGARMSGIGSRRAVRTCRSAFRLWEQRVREVSRQNFTERLHHCVVKCLQGSKSRQLMSEAFGSLSLELNQQRRLHKLETDLRSKCLALQRREKELLRDVESLGREVEESRLAREHTEGELFHTQEALAKAMANGRKLEDSRQLADEELHVKLEQYRLETHRFQADFIRAQMEAQRLQHCLDEALRDRGRAEQDFQMKTRMLESRCCAAEEALSTLRSSLPILEVGDKALDTVRLELATSGAEQSEGKGMRRRQEEVVRRTEGETQPRAGEVHQRTETQPRAGEVHQRTEMDLSIELAREVGKSQELKRQREREKDREQERERERQKKHELARLRLREMERAEERRSDSKTHHSVEKGNGSPDRSEDVLDVDVLREKRRREVEAGVHHLLRTHAEGKTQAGHKPRTPPEGSPMSASHLASPATGSGASVDHIFESGREQSPASQSRASATSSQSSLSVSQTKISSPARSSGLLRSAAAQRLSSSIGRVGSEAAGKESNRVSPGARRST